MPFAGKVLSEKYSAARLTFDFLKRASTSCHPREKRRAIRGVPALRARSPTITIAGFTKFPSRPTGRSRCRLWAASRRIARLSSCASRRCRAGCARPCASAQDAMRRSMELADSTMVVRELDNGVTLRTACCFGYSSEVAAHLYENTHPHRDRAVRPAQPGRQPAAQSRLRGRFLEARRAVRRRWSCGGERLHDARAAQSLPPSACPKSSPRGSMSDSHLPKNLAIARSPRARPFARISSSRFCGPNATTSRYRKGPRRCRGESRSFHPRSATANACAAAPANWARSSRYAGSHSPTSVGADSACRCS